MSDESTGELAGRVFTALLGSVCALFYGLLIAIVVALATGRFIGEIVGWTVAVFAVVGFFFGNVIFEALLVILHFFYGLANGVVENWHFDEENDAQGALRAMGIVGFFTGLILLVVFYAY